jgi:hypothetical protein
MSMTTTAQWDVFEASFSGPSGGNPFLDVTLEAFFQQKSRVVRVPGFYDGDGIFRVRFMPDNEGDWSFSTKSNVAELDGKTGSFSVTAPRAGVHGPVRVANKFHFAYADGTPFLSFGTTCYAWTHQPLSEQAKTLETLKKTRFNKMRMGVFPKDYPYNVNEALHDVYQKGADGKFDFDRPNPESFRHFENQVKALGEMGIEADIIIFHPYDRWGYCDMSEAQDYAYVQYLAARLAQRLVVARQRVRFPPQHQADASVGALLPYSGRERSLWAPPLDPQWRPGRQLRSPQALGHPCLHPALGREAHR